MSYEVNFDGLTQNLNSIILGEEGTMLQEIAKPEIIKSVRITANKSLRLFLKDQKYFVELISSSYKVTQLAGNTPQEAEKFYITLLKEIF